MSSNLGPLTPPGNAIYPTRRALHGTYTSLVSLEQSHWEALFEELGGPENASLWNYVPTEGFADKESCQTTIASYIASKDFVFYVVLSGPASDSNSRPLGLIAFLAIVPEQRRIEVGSVIFGSKLKQTRVATEAFHLFIKHAFEDLGYLRVEWKANSLNKPSLSAAERIGFKYEGTFRKHMIAKGRRRDSAYFSIIDDEWPGLDQGFKAWLDENNFDEQGKQRRGLKECRNQHEN
ncbi:hypothetical protein S40293_04002 [Stachybotrys chartarum IBT 40293]|nr:hypothetical protein S40293_04002 [Stachybotrys chartarum IBT 40293]